MQLPTLTLKNWSLKVKAHVAVIIIVVVVVNFRPLMGALNPL